MSTFEETEKTSKTKQLVSKIDPESDEEASESENPGAQPISGKLDKKTTKSEDDEKGSKEEDEDKVEVPAPEFDTFCI